MVSCECEDWVIRRRTCKHMFLVNRIENSPILDGDYTETPNILSQEVELPIQSNSTIEPGVNPCLSAELACTHVLLGVSFRSIVETSSPPHPLPVH